MHRVDMLSHNEHLLRVVTCMVYFTLTLFFLSLSYWCYLLFWTKITVTKPFTAFWYLTIALTPICFMSIFKWSHIIMTVDSNCAVFHHFMLLSVSLSCDIYLISLFVDCVYVVCQFSNLSCIKDVHNCSVLEM